MRTIRTTTGVEIQLDGDVLAIMETLYKEITVKHAFDRSFEDMMHEIHHLIDQMTEDEKSSVETARSALNETLADADADSATIRSSMEALITASQAMATRLYQQAAAGQQASAGDGGSSDDDEVVEAEIVDDEDE